MRVKNSLYNVVVGISYILIHTLSSFIITHLLLSSFGSEINGLLSSIKQILSYAVLIEGGLGAACIISYYGPLASDNREEIKHIFAESGRFYKKVGAIYTIFLGICCIIYPLIVTTPVGKTEVSLVMLCTGLAQILQYIFLEQYQSLIIADQRNRVVQLLATIGDTVNIIIIYGLIKLSARPNIILVQSVNILVSIIKIIICKLYFHRNYSDVYKYKAKDGFKGIIKQKSATFMHVIASQISFSTDIVVLTLFRSLQEVSVYSVYNLVANFISYIFSILSNGVASSFGNLYNTDKKLFADRFKTYELLSIMFNSIVTISISWVLKGFIHLYTRNNIDIEYWNTSYAVLFILIAYLNNLRTPHAAMIRASGNFEKTKYYFLGEASMNLIISLALVNRYGIIGVLIGTLFSALFRDVFVIRFIYKRVIEVEINNFAKIIFANLIITIIASYIGFSLSIEFDSYPRFVFYGGCTVIISFLVVVTVNVLLNRSNTIYLISYIKNIKFNLSHTNSGHT